MSPRNLKSPEREARRQAELTRMQQRIIAWVPKYIDKRDRQNNIIASEYLYHYPLRAGGAR